MSAADRQAIAAIERAERLAAELAELRADLNRLRIDRELDSDRIGHFEGLGIEPRMVALEAKGDALKEHAQLVNARLAATEQLATELALTRSDVARLNGQMEAVLEHAQLLHRRLDALERVNASWAPRADEYRERLENVERVIRQDHVLPIPGVDL